MDLGPIISANIKSSQSTLSGGFMNQPITRQIRVFISSTFRDMAAERDQLVKFVFP